MQVIKEFSASFTPADIQSNIMKGCVAIFLGEVLTSVLKEEIPNEELFDFIEESVRYFDSCRNGYANFHIAFLSGLSSYLGFEPSKRSGTGDLFFDMQNGAFVSAPPLHGNYTDPEISDILAAFFSSSYRNIDKINLTGSLRNEVLEAITGYYSLHLPGLKKLKSLVVLKEVFS
jgi:DNA repair protein RecO (recombination protein O)